MSEYREDLDLGEVAAVFEELGLDVSVAMEDLFKSYEGWKWTLMRHEVFSVILNILPGSGVSAKHFWEEWYIQSGSVHHHILTLDEPETFDEIFVCPESDDIHPPEVWGKTWYVQNRTSMEPLLVSQ